MRWYCDGLELGVCCIKRHFGHFLTLRVIANFDISIFYFVFVFNFFDFTHLASLKLPLGGTTSGAAAGGSTAVGTTAFAATKPAFGGNAAFAAGPSLGFGTTPAKGIFGASGEWSLIKEYKSTLPV